MRRRPDRRRVTGRNREVGRFRTEVGGLDVDELTGRPIGIVGRAKGEAGRGFGRLLARGDLERGELDAHPEVDVTLACGIAEVDDAHSGSQPTSSDRPCEGCRHRKWTGSPRQAIVNAKPAVIAGHSHFENGRTI